MRVKSFAVAIATALSIVLPTPAAHAQTQYDTAYQTINSLTIASPAISYTSPPQRGCSLDITNNWESWLSNPSIYMPNYTAAPSQFDAMSAAFGQAKANGSWAVSQAGPANDGTASVWVVFTTTPGVLNWNWMSASVPGPAISLAATGSGTTYAVAIRPTDPSTCNPASASGGSSSIFKSTSSYGYTISGNFSNSPGSGHPDNRLFLISGNFNPNYPSGYAGPQIPVWGPVPYVAMGDSFSAGEGTSPFFPDSHTSDGSNVCDRSIVAYSQLLPGEIKNLADPTFAACSGAITADIFNDNHSGNLTTSASGATIVEPAQIRRLSQGTRLVTLTIGGNDLGFAEIMGQCVVPATQLDPHCQNKPAEGAVPARLIALQKAASFDSQGNAVPTSEAADGTSAKIYSWRTIIEAIHAKAPNATIAIAGYPQLVDPSGSAWSWSLAGTTCVVGSAIYSDAKPYPGQSGTGVQLVIYEDEAAWLSGMIAQADADLKQAVQEENQAGVPQAVYVDPGTFSGHSLCDGNSWVNPVSASFLTKTSTPTTIGELLFPVLSAVPVTPWNEQIWPGSFHPTQTGQADGYAAAFATALPSSF